jgi:diamine N-acetyltransferase
MWEGKRIHLRQVEFSDLQTLLNWENNPENWEVSETNTPFSEEEMIDFIVEQSDFKNTNQLRLMICLNEINLPIGAIDLFEINQTKKTAGVGILINEKQYRQKGYAFEALELLKQISLELVELKKLFCTIHATNESSIKLFLKSGFAPTSEDINREVIEYQYTI